MWTSCVRIARERSDQARHSLESFPVVASNVSFEMLLTFSVIRVTLDIKKNVLTITPFLVETDLNDANTLKLTELHNTSVPTARQRLHTWTFEKFEAGGR